MTPHDLQQVLERYSRGECSPEEKKLVDDWYENIGHSDQQFEFPNSDFEEGLWAKLKPEQPIKESFYKSTWLKIAAGVSILIVLSFLYFNSLPTQQSSVAANDVDESDFFTTQLVNQTTKSKKFRLEDGSEITLEPNSVLLLPKAFSVGKREVVLKGEAFFDIERDTLRPFFVYTKEVVTKVLGTSFNIKALDTEGEITVSVKTGKVSVYKKPTEKVETKSDAYILTPNQEVVFNRRDEKIVKQLVEEPAIILENPTLFQMHYKDTPVTEIFKVMEENYGVDIQYNSEEISGCVLTTNMSDEGLFERIHIICKAINATYTITDAVIVVHGNGCN